jgi:hypothetical protein
MEDIVFYAACATRRMIDRRDIREEKPCLSFEEASAYENKFMHDDDDWGVMANIGGVWLRVWARDSTTGELLVTDEHGGWSGRRSAKPLSDYLGNH